MARVTLCLLRDPGCLSFVLCKTRENVVRCPMIGCVKWFWPSKQRPATAAESLNLDHCDTKFESSLAQKWESQHMQYGNKKQGKTKQVHVHVWPHAKPTLRLAVTGHGFSAVYAKSPAVRCGFVPLGARHARVRGVVEARVARRVAHCTVQNRTECTNSLSKEVGFAATESAQHASMLACTRVAPCPR